MLNDDEAFLNIHPNRSIEVFEALIEKWNGILISDDYGVYQKWAAKRQTCLAHLIRRAKGLRERKDPDIARFGIWCTSELQRLCNMAKKPPTQGEWNAFYARLCRLIGLYRDDKNDAGRMALRLDKEIESLFVFLDEEGVDPTNNHAERMLRCAVIWRKRNQGTESTKGQRWVERILTLRHTCKLRARKLFPVLVDAVQCFFSYAGELPWLDAFCYYKCTLAKTILNHFICLSRNQRLLESQIFKTSVREQHAHFLCRKEGGLPIKNARILLVPILLSQFAFFIHKAYNDASAGLQYSERFPEGFENIVNKTDSCYHQYKVKLKTRKRQVLRYISKNPDSLLFSFRCHPFRWLDANLYSQRHSEFA